jgi:sulfonate transport system substrate-binding protein
LIVIGCPCRKHGQAGSLDPIDDSVGADEQKTIDLYFRSGLISGKLHASDILDRSFSAAIAKGAGL